MRIPKVITLRFTIPLLMILLSTYTSIIPQNRVLTTHQLMKYVIGSGGVFHSENSNFIHYASLGECIAGGNQSQQYFHTVGFWGPDLLIPTGINDIIGSEIPTEFNLLQNYPNPFNPITTISFTVPRGEFSEIHIKLKIYDVLGREVKSLIESEVKPGVHLMEFDASLLPSGVYLYRLESTDYIETRKMILLK